jgi:tRNA threonylcarbamoyladenosine biosynthesis protein TsaE
MEWLVHSLAELDSVAAELLTALGPARKIALYGEMGAGKTTFTAAFCRALGVTDATSSPTFSLINEYRYPLPDGSTGLLHHLDLYRLRSAQEAFDIGIEDVLYDPWYCLIEWPQVVESLLPPGTVRVELEWVSETERWVRLQLFTF